MTKSQLDVSALTDMLKNFSAQAAQASVSTKQEKSPWWYTYTYPDASEVSVKDLLSFTKKALFFQALEGGEQIHECTKRKSFAGDRSKIITKLTKDNFARAVYENVGEDFLEWFLIKPKAGIYIKVYGWNNSNSMDLTIVTTDKADIDKVIAEVNSL